MRMLCCWIFGFAIALNTAAAAEPQTTLKETWDAAYLEGVKAGFVHTTVQESLEADQKIIKTKVELELNVRRFTDTVRLRMETGNDETMDGKVTAVSMRQFLGKQQQLVMTGTVEGNQLHVLVDGGRRSDKHIPWDDQVMGMHRQEEIFREREVKPNDSFSYRSYEPTITAVITTKVNVKNYEEVPGTAGGTREKLLRVEATSSKIAGIQLPPLTMWLNKNYVAVRSQVEMPGLGKLTLYRTSKEAALRPGSARTDIGITQLIPLNERINHPYDTESAVYRITFKGDADPRTMFKIDDRQQVKNITKNSFELHVRAIKRPAEVENPIKAKPEFLKSSYFINSDDARVKDHARHAVGMESDPWLKAKRIEKWVHEHMENKNFTEAFATSDHVARTLEGDCTEHAVLAAAMCRAAGVPSRAAVGLVYVDMPRGPFMGFHMWAEAWVDGQWMPIDGTLGRGYVGASHLKIADHSWYNTQSLTPLLPALQVLTSKISIEVLGVNAAE